MFRNCDIAGCEIQTGNTDTPLNRASLVTHIAFFYSNSLQNHKIGTGVCVISSFYKAFVQFLSHSIELILK